MEKQTYAPGKWVLAAGRGGSGDWRDDGRVRKEDLMQLGRTVGRQTYVPAGMASTELEGKAFAAK